MRFSGRRKKRIFQIPDSNDESEEKKHVEIGYIDRSRYPKHTFWIIFAAAGAVLMWFIIRFFFIIIRG